MESIYNYWLSVLVSVKPVYALFGTMISYVLFPRESYIPAAIALAVAMVLDILTKFWAISKTNGGYWSAVKNGHIRSSKLWEGTSRKLISYLVVLIMAGLSIRVSPVAQVAVWLTALVYFILFIREFQSNLENLAQAGYTGFDWLLRLLKRKEIDILEQVTTIEKVAEVMDQHK